MAASSERTPSPFEARRKRGSHLRVRATLAQLPPHDRGAIGERLQLSKRDLARQIFHPAIGRRDQAVRRDVLQPGAVSDLVKTQYGYEIIKVTEKNGDTTRASHILIKTVDFDEYFQEQVKNAKVKKYIKV